MFILSLVLNKFYKNDHISKIIKGFFGFFYVTENYLSLDIFLLFSITEDITQVYKIAIDLKCQKR